ncbi:MAG: LPS-assembly protein LptD [Pseudomonadota bacterium]
MSGTGRPAKPPGRGVGRARWAFVGLWVLLALGAGAGPAHAQDGRPPERALPALLAADEVIWDEDLGVATANGNVEIAQGERVLRADSVSYNQRANTVVATGNVSLLEPTGEVIFADYVELTGGMREGVVQNLRMLLADQSRLAAVSGRRIDGNLTVARKVVYSPCELCPRDPTRAPVWQIKAARVIHDQEAKQITYNDAVMEILGIPVAYTPYLSHPDGTVPRSSGLLAPDIGSASFLGQFLTVPYYQILGPDKDLTFEPIFFTKVAPVLAGEYRQRTTTGTLQVSASLTNPDRRDDLNNRVSGHDPRGHLKGDGKFEIDDDWRWGFNVERASDDTYLQRYKLLQRYHFLDSNTLTSNAFLEGFRGRNYAAANAFAFQGLRAGDKPGLAPVVLPLLDYNYIGEPGAYGGRTALDANALSVYRSDGTRMQRTALKAGWVLPYMAPTGEVYALSVSTLGEGYHVSSIGTAADPSRPTADGTSGRVFPQVSLGWRYPWVQRGEELRTLVEPVASLVAAPNLGDQRRFPNEDSRGVDFDETNLFRANRFNGLDRLEGGQRASYGLNTEVARAGGGKATVFVGQSYRLRTESAFARDSGLDKKSSNVVGRVGVSPHPWFSTGYRFQLDPDEVTATRSLASAAIGPSALNLSVSYIFIERSSQPNLGADIEQVSTQLTAQLTPHWRAVTRSLSSIAQDSGTLLAGASLIYEDECLIAGLDFTRRYIGSRDNPPDTALVLRMVFRNLGEVKTALF